jgi:uncharacterized membrane protein YagU involved in acid resistance
VPETHPFVSLHSQPEAEAVDWSAEQGSAVFGSLVGHILYGLILGVAYASIDKIWVRLFIQSDPLNREIEGPGLHILRSLGWGATAGLIGGLVSMPVMIATGVLPKVVGVDSTLVGFHGVFIHLSVSAAIGMTYGLLFRNETSTPGDAISWGWLFGLIWWYLGPMTLLPLLLTGVCDWSTDAASTLLPSLLGHLIYGAATALVFFLFDQRYTRCSSTPALRSGNCVDSVHGRAPRPHSGSLHSAWVCFSQSYLASCSVPILRIACISGNPPTTKDFSVFSLFSSKNTPASLELLPSVILA